MEKEVRDDILAILKRTIEILKEREEKDVLELKELSDHTVHDASIYQTIDTMEMAIVVYSLYKFLDRRVPIPEKLYQQLQKELATAYDSLIINDLHTYNEHTQGLFEIIRKIDQSMPTYVQEVIDKARITKGNKLFEHGLTAKRAAEIMGVTEWELLSYIGKTTTIDKYKMGGISVKKRLGYAEELFR